MNKLSFTLLEIATLILGLFQEGQLYCGFRTQFIFNEEIICIYPPVCQSRHAYLHCAK